MAAARAVVFDLDGTLIDSAPDIHAAAARLLAEEGRAPLSLPVIRSFIGNGVPTLIERVIAAAGLDRADHPRLTERFMVFYDAAPADLTRPFPGVPEALNRLADAGFALGLCTNKPESATRGVLSALGLDRFEVLVCGDSLQVRKPDPSVLDETFRRLGADGVYVGDSEVDAETAERAVRPFALFTGGYRKTPVEAIRHDRNFADFAELPAIAMAMCAAVADEERA